MLEAYGWYLHGAPEAYTDVRTVGEVLAKADWLGHAAVSVRVDGGRETFRRIAGEWICIA